MTLAAQAPEARIERTAKPTSTTPRRDVGRAIRALFALFRDKEDTAQVFEIMRALNGDSSRKGYQRLLSTPDGGRLAYERLELADKLMDDAWLDRFPAGTVGAAYREFIRSENLSAEGLAEESRKGLPAGAAEAPHPYAWFGRRMRDSHDIWHVLTGYGRDALGEASLVAFSYQQTKGLGWALIAFGAMSRIRGREGRPYRAAIREGFRRGKACAWLPGEDYEALLAEPLESARRRLGLMPPIAYEEIPAERRNGDKAPSIS
ncbi:MAG TPA: Coq4 family protein [Caulobacteraceae bacterium]|nr:Coq4 family protein [Caulobacteraceae bacterium]